jgi:ubiquinone biosynthesis protein UbiJ
VGTLAALVYEESSLDESLRTGHVKIEGDESVVERLLTLFPLHRSAAPSAEV